MELLNNWLVQSIIANAVCFVLGKICIYFYKILKSNNSTIKEKPLSKYSKKSLRKQFYISFVVLIVSSIVLHFKLGNNYLTALSVTAIFWCIFFMYCAFECSLECFEDFPSNRR